MPANPGMSPEVQQAFARRQMGATPTPALNQMSPQAAGAPPVPPPMPQSEMTKASAPPQAPAQKFQAKDRKDLIVMTLVEQLKNDNKLDKEQATMAQPSPMPMGGGYPPVSGGGFSMSPGYEQPMPINQMQSDYGNGLGRDYSGLSNYGRGGF